MINHSTAFDKADLETLLALYDTTGSDRRPPWTWSVLDVRERAALARMIDVWVDTYNHVHVTKISDIIPSCWRSHPALATELAVQVWLWYTAHIHPQTAPLIAGDYYLRHLPGFRTRVSSMLGTSPPECRRGEHPASWRDDAERQLNGHEVSAESVPAQVDHIDQLGKLHFGFPKIGDR